MKETPPSITQIEMTEADIALAEAAACREVLKELVRDVECYCADNVASKEPCASCKAKEVLKQAEAPI